MSTIKPQTRRRRSHSVSSLFASSTSSPNTARRLALKRSFPQQFSSPLGESRRWDMEGHRRGKRRRRVLSAGSDGVARISKTTGFNTHSQTSVRPSKSTFAVSSDDFGLPLSRGKKRDRTWRSPSFKSASEMDVSDSHSYESLRRLRSNAFWELERSVEQGGEGFIGRMREHEHLRSSSLGANERNRSSRFSSGQSPAHSFQSYSDISGDEDDDIQIYAGEASTKYTPHSPDMAIDAVHCQFNNQSFAPRHSFNTSFLHCRVHHAYADDPLSTLPNSSPLSSSPPTSPMSDSMADLPVSSQISICHPQSAPAGPVHPHYPTPDSDGSEKVIEALALALANGAGGINDYGALRQFGGEEDVNVCDAGDLWR